MSTREIPIDEPAKNTADGDGGEEQKVSDGADAGTGPAEETLEEKVAALEAEVTRLRDQALRAVADLENFKRRAQTERIQIVEYANERLLRDLLPLVDDIKRSVDSGAQTSDYQSFYQGVSMINDKLAKLLEAQGVSRIETVGKEFDVNLHEALMRQPSEAPEDTVISELEPGYRYGDRVLRHAKVIISAGS